MADSLNTTCSSPGTSRRRILRTICLWLVAASYGCGTGTYEKRLDETVQLYNYLQAFEQNLEASTWQKPEYGLSMRTPKPFSAPLASGGVGSAVDNPLEVALPGVIESWVAVWGNSPGPNAYLYVLGNHSLIEARGVGDSSQGFLKEVEATLSQAFGVTIPPDEVARPGDNTRFRHMVPRRDSPAATYTNVKDYVGMIFAGNARRAVEAQLFTRTEGNTQVAVVLVLTERSNPQLRQRMDLSLQTLEVQEIKLRPSAGGGRGQPAGAGTGGF